MTDAAASSRRRNTRNEASHDDILQAISDLRSETRVGFAEMNGRIDGMDKGLAELSTSLQRNWTQTDEHSLALARADAVREALQAAPKPESEATATDRTVIYVPRSMMRLMTWGTLTLLIAILVIAAMAGVSLPKWMG